MDIKGNMFFILWPQLQVCILTREKTEIPIHVEN